MQVTESWKLLISFWVFWKMVFPLFNFARLLKYKDNCSVWWLQLSPHPPPPYLQLWTLRCILTTQWPYGTCKEGASTWVPPLSCIMPLRACVRVQGIVFFSLLSLWVPVEFRKRQQFPHDGWIWMQGQRLEMNECRPAHLLFCPLMDDSGIVCFP